MGRKAKKRVAYVTGSYALVPLSLDSPDLLVCVSRAVVFFSCERCGAPAGQLCLNEKTRELMRDGHRRPGKRRNNVNVAEACLELVESGRFHEVHVLEQRLVLKARRGA